MADKMARACVIGHPIAHSRSPLIHGTWLAEYGVTGTFSATDISPADLPAFIHALRDGDWDGCNVTIPHKQAVIAHVDELTATAETIGAVNTIWRDGDCIIGDNTDAYGFLANLDQSAPGWDESRDAALVLGAGGAANAIVHALIERGFSDIRIANRTPERAEALAGHFGNPCRAVSWGNEAALYEEVTLMVNTSAITMGEGAGQRKWPGLDRLPGEATVTDIVYTPLMTSLLSEANKRGLRQVDGLGMLLHQAVPGFERWFGRRPKVTDALRNRIIADLDSH